MTRSTSGEPRSPADVAGDLADDLSPLGDVTTKAMFGGFGIFEQGTMFALVDKEGVPYLRTDEASAARFEEQGSHRHRPMPYHSIPENVLTDPDLLLAWAGEAIALAHRLKG